MSYFCTSVIISLLLFICVCVVFWTLCSESKHFFVHQQALLKCSVLLHLVLFKISDDSDELERLKNENIN